MESRELLLSPDESRSVVVVDDDTESRWSRGSHHRRLCVGLEEQLVAAGGRTTSLPATDDEDELTLMPNLEYLPGWNSLEVVVVR